MMTRKRKFRSILYKNTLSITILGFILVLFLSILWPRLFYMIAKNELSPYISNTVSECSVRVSYLLSNHRTTMDLRRNGNLTDLIRQYYQKDSNQDALADEISSFLRPNSMGHPDNGSIYTMNHSILATDRGDCFFYKDDADSYGEALAEAFQNSGILENIHMDENGNFYSDQYYLDRDAKCYTPIMTFDLNGEETEFLCFIGAFTVDDIPCYAVSLTPFDDIRRQLDSLNAIDLEDYAILSDNHILFQNRKDSELTQQIFQYHLLDQQQYNVASAKYDSGILFCVLCSYPSESFYIAANATRSEIVAPYKNFFYLLELLFCLLVLFMVFIFDTILRISLKRLKKLDQQMQEIQTGDFDIVLKDEKADEIGNIVETINMMVATIKNNFEQQIALEKMEKEMQYNLLASAIDPHFIYNILDTVTFLAAMGKCDDIIKVNNALIGTLKDRIKMKHLKIYDSIENEKQVVEQYMIIESYLYSNPIDFQFLAREENYALQIPKNIIQPLVENAIKHGLMPNKDENRLYTKSGQIIVKVWKEHNVVCISVTDNGIGMTEDKKEYYLSETDWTKIDSEHIGLFNIRFRLAYLYQDKFDFQIQDAEGGGTIITIRLYQ